MFFSDISISGYSLQNINYFYKLNNLLNHPIPADYVTG